MHEARQWRKREAEAKATAHANQLCFANSSQRCRRRRRRLEAPRAACPSSTDAHLSTDRLFGPSGGDVRSAQRKSRRRSRAR